MLHFTDAAKRASVNAHHICLSCQLRAKSGKRSPAKSATPPSPSQKTAQDDAGPKKKKARRSHLKPKPDASIPTEIHPAPQQRIRKVLESIEAKPSTYRYNASKEHVSRVRKYHSAQRPALIREEWKTAPVKAKRHVMPIPLIKKHIKADGLPIRKAVPPFHVRDLRKQHGLPNEVKNAVIREAAQESQFLGVLDAHESAAREITTSLEVEEESEGLREEEAAAFSYRPFAEVGGEQDATISTSQIEIHHSEQLVQQERHRTDYDIDEDILEGFSGSSAMPFSPAATRYAQRMQEDARMARRQPSRQHVKKPSKIEWDAPIDDAKEEQSKNSTQTSLLRVSAQRQTRDVDPLALPSLYHSYPRPAMHGLSGLSQGRPRLLHTSARVNQEAAATAPIIHAEESPPDMIFGSTKPHKYSRIRQQFRQWQDLNGNPEEDTKPQPIFDIDDSSSEGVLNSMTRLPDMPAALRQSGSEAEEERSGIAQFSTADSRDGMAAEAAPDVDTAFLTTGDLVELEYTSSERNSVLAVFIRRIPGGESQFFTLQGRWVFMKEKGIMWSISRWASKEQIAPLLAHLPSPRSTTEMEELKEKAQVEDLSVPRSVSAPLVNRLVKFWTETQEIYRKHASVLDDAHNLLAHETDLRYGSLVSAAATLLQIPARELPITALFAVRTALSRSPLAFNIDRRSHRMTGYIQIRSKETVRMVHYVRDWMRDWQDDVAKRSQLAGEGEGLALRKHRTTIRAQYVYSFLEKARKIVLKSREDRNILPSRCGNIGISQKRFPIEEGSDAVRITQDTQFTEQDTEIIRFIEAWCTSSQLYLIPAYAGLPPMLLQATGLYEQFEELDQTIGFTFLQELGVMMPYENRVRFDQHLLLPSSQHSKPLQNLMDSLIKMANDHRFTDSMKHLRKDWGSLPVYCIDPAGAQEIDDGVSIEHVPGKEDEYWLHAHVANPTAFFERDHPLAKMARHMGESIYFPERSYMMLPRWATNRHFSLTKHRPCITFSTRMNLDGDILERDITSGIVRNVISLTPSEVTSLLDEKDPTTNQLILTVGGDPPPEKSKKSMIDNVTVDMKQALKTMKVLTDKFGASRKARGGIFFDNQENEISVWQAFKGPGLAWDHPWRRGSRTVEGDPIIQLKSGGLISWFAPQIPPGVSMIREMMLLAGETAATWCADRGIPTIFRGTVTMPDAPDADAFYREVVAPAVQEKGEIPPYLGIRYFTMRGRSALRTKPIAHQVAGLQQYVKTTSPLRRYGDMIVHWQVEAALREEAKLGRSLTPQDTARDSFLPFSARVLETIMLGLQPREQLITRSKQYARDFWSSMVLFRAHHFGECELPFAATTDEQAATGKPLLRFWLHSPTFEHSYCMGIIDKLNMSATMLHPSRYGLEQPMRGDTWEVEIDYVDVYKRSLVGRPVRLVDRPVDANFERWKHIVP